MKLKDYFLVNAVQDDGETRGRSDPFTSLISFVFFAGIISTAAFIIGVLFYLASVGVLKF